MDNLYDQDEMKDTAAAQPAAVSHVQPDNFFAETIGEAPARPGANETIVPKTTPGRSWKDDLMDGISIDNARESARARTDAEKKNPRVETPEEASFWGSAEHALGNQNIEAFADAMDHLADWSGDKWWSRKAQSIRDSLKKDGSSYRPVYESYKQIGGLKDAWGYVKETVGNQVGVMAPSILGAAALGGIGATQGELVGGKTGAMVGGAVGGMAGAAAGTIHLQVSEMRQALQREGLKGEDLVKYTNMGAAILTLLDVAFPALQAAKIGGFARKQIAEKVSQKLVQNLVQGGKMRTAAEFTKQFGKEVIKDAVLLEVPTELAQEALTELGAKKMAGKNITGSDVQKFATETAPEVILRTIIGAGGMALPGSGAQAYRDVRDARKAAVFPGDKPSTGAEATEVEGAPPPAPIDGSSEPGIQPPMEDPSREVAPNPAAGAKGQGVIRFIQSMGGMQPSGELDALDAHRYPGLINQNGRSADQMREVLVEAGYLEESGPDQPNITTPDDVFDLVQRAISGERIVPLQDQQADAEFHAALETKDAEKELKWAEDQFVLPAIEHYDEEAGDPILSQAYRKLRPDERIEVIDRVRKGEDVFNVVEEIFTANVDTEMVAAMVQAYGPNPELVERVRTMIAQQQPDLLAGFDDMIAQFPTRRPKVAREPVRRAGDEPTELVRGLGGRLKAIAGDAQAFNIAIGEIERDRKILKDDAYRIASDFLGTPPKKGTKASYFQAIRDAQTNPGAAAPVSGPANVQQTSAKLSKEPAVPVQQSVAPEAITSLIDGSRHTDLRPHLKKQGVSVEDYARNYRLAENYPLVAENVVAEKHAGTRQRDDFETYAKRFTVGGEIRAREEYDAQIRKAAASPVAELLDTAYPEDLAGAKKRLADKPKTLEAIAAMEAAGRELRSKIEAGDPDIRPAAQRFAEAGRRADEVGAAEGAPGAVVRLATQNAKSAGRQLPLPQGASAQAAQPAEPQQPRDLMQEIIKLANSKTPRDEWGAILGLQPHQMHNAVTEAVQAGILAYDKRGVARRAPMDQVKDAKGIVAEFEALLDEAMPTEKTKGGRDVPVPAAAKNWHARALTLIEQIKRLPLADGQKIAAKLLGRKVTKTEVSSRPKIVAAVTARINSMTDARLKSAMQSGSAAFIAPGNVANENVMLTPEAETKAEALQRVVDDAVAGILPANVRVDVVDNIAIGRLAREDELYALRSSRSDIMSDTEVSDELPSDSRKIGQEGDGASESGAPAGTAATVGGGLAAGEAGGEGRILRQESATLRSDGSIFVGRPVGASRSANAGARDAAASQPIGTSQFFDVDGFRGVVTAADVADHAGLAERNAPPSEYRLATLTYRLYAADTPMTEANLIHDPATRGFKANFRAGGEARTPLIWARISQHMDGTWEVSNIQRIADHEDAPRGMSDKLYAAIEKDLGIHMSPSGYLSPQGYAMWKKRSPGSVQWHQPSDSEQGYYISPRRVKDRLDEIGKQIRTFAAVAARDPNDKQTARDLAGARKERGELIKMWSKMPVEARAATPNMFSLRGFYSPTLRAAESLKQDRGSGDQFLKAILATPGVKADEIAWIGLERFLKGKESITKNALMAWIKANQVKMDELVRSKMSTKAAQPSFTPEPDLSFLETETYGMASGMSTIREYIQATMKRDGMQGGIEKVWRMEFPRKTYMLVTYGPPSDQWVTAFGFGNNGVWIPDGRWTSLSTARHNLLGQYESENGQGTMFGDYVVPGGKNYREFLLRVPQLKEARDLTAEERQALEEVEARRQELLNDIGSDINRSYEDTAPLYRELESQDRIRQTILAAIHPYESPHFIDQEVVHIRADDRTLPDGRRVLFINEVQSDLHQRARARGYEGQETAQNRDRRLQEAGARFDELNDAYHAVFETQREVEMTPERVAQKKELDRARKAMRALQDLPLPNAPFKGDLYLELALKRALQEAIEGGYDAVSWARSEQIAKAVEGAEEGMVEQYDKKIRRFYDKYAKPYGGKVGEVAGLVDERDPNDDPAKRMIDFMEANRQDALRLVETARIQVEEQDANYPYYGGDMLDAFDDIKESIRSGADIFTVMASIPTVIAADGLEINPVGLIAEVFAKARPQAVRNQILDITPEMRKQIPATGQPLYSISGNDPNRALGMTDPYAEAISIGAKAVEAEARASGRSMAEVAKTAARHEALEFFLAQGVINPAEWSALQRAAISQGWVEATGVREAYTQQFGDQMGPQQLNDLILKESIMEMYGRYRADSFKPKGIVRVIFKRLSDFIEKLANRIKGNGFTSWEEIFQKVDQGELRRRYEEIYGRTDQVNTAAMIRAGVIPDARGIATAPGTTRAPAPSAARQQSAAQRAVQRFLPRQRPLKALSELMRDFQVAAGLSARTGRMDPAMQRQATAAGGGQVQGMYNGVARLRVQRDFDTFSHEAGHHIQRILGGRLTVAMNAFSHELLPLAGLVVGQGNVQLNEGFAEFFRRYLTNEAAARAQAPGFYRAFENAVEAENPRLFWTLQDIQDEYDNFLLGDPLDRGAAQQTVLTRPTSATRRFLQDAERDGFVSTMADRLYDLHHGFIQAVFDKRHGWWMATRGLLNEIERVTGQRVTLRASDNPNKLIRMTSHTQAWAMQDLKEGIALRSRPNGGGVSMHQVLATAFGGTAQSAWNEARARAFGDYLIARRAVLLYVRYRPQFRVQIQQFVAANPQMGFLLARLPNNAVSDLANPPTAEPLYEHLNRLKEHEQRNPQFRQAAELYYNFNKDLIQLLYEKGLITLEEKNEYQQDRDYCPFQRNMEDRELVDNEDNRSKRPPRGRDKANKYDVYRRIEGSMRDIVNPIQSTVQTMFEVRLRAAINDTLAAMDRVARQAGQAGNEIFERLPPTEARMVEVRIREQLRQAARAAGMTATDTAIMLTNVESQIGANVVTTMFTQAQTSEKGEKIVWFFENGKPIPAQLPDGELGQMMFHGLTAVGQRNMGQLMEAAATITSVARVGVTFSFGFMIRNIITDAIASSVNSPYARPLLTQAAGIREIATGGRYLHLYNRYAGMMGGAGHASMSDQSIERDIQALRMRGFNVRVPRSFRDFVKLIFQVGEFSETATRVGIFRNAMISARRDGMTPFDAAIEAGHYAHDVMDYNQHGSKTEAFRRVIPFFNAALQGLYRYGKTLTAANDYGNLIQIWDRHSRGLPLSRNEQRALGQAGKAWLISTVVLGATSLIFSMLGADDDDMKEVPDQIRATHWRISLNGVLHLLPKNISTFLAGEDAKADWMIRLPKPFEIAWFANAVERAWDYLVDSDPNAAKGMASDFFTTLLPPHSITATDLVYGFVTGKDLYSGNSIVPIWEQGPNELERKEQFGPYTSWTAKQIGEALNISPYYAEFIIRNLTTSVGQDAASGLDAALGEGPMPSIAEYPVARRFTYNSGKSSKSLSTFYNMMTDGEGLNRWFWDTFTEDARSFNSASNTYGKMIDAGGENSVIASEFLGRVNPDQRVFAVLSQDFKGRTKGKYRNLHPMINAAEGVKIANSIMKEVVSGELIQDKGEKGEARTKMDREQMRFARNEIGHIRKGMAQNALQIMGVDGWREQKLMDIDARLKTLKAGAPEVYDEMLRRMKKEKIQDTKHLSKVWGKVRERVDSQRKDADLGDLYGPGVGE